MSNRGAAYIAGAYEHPLRRITDGDPRIGASVTAVLEPVPDAEPLLRFRLGRTAGPPAVPR